MSNVVMVLAFDLQEHYIRKSFLLVELKHCSIIISFTLLHVNTV